ncbi:transcriptional regulator [Saccharomonospora marina XMU15]|uniref:Transcriptional regulator n=1 Tax=Saccharomonospora marina XMU15 TaxID=882083 RepID=H5X455_9PSEU|nr:TetR/AcrR family transcriptional regulator [Saccharomonospora marina]EHR53328.1 transcriptional regulator [Saccharomonospora marina XMU15]
MQRAHRTARERARAELTVAIKAEARRQLGEVGAQSLSLRAVARELGMVSSALYRYFSSRDELITALIVDAYNSLGEATERAASVQPSPRRRWTASCHAVRGWARANPHEYSLIYGSPIPGYRAPQDTIAPAGRVPIVLVSTLRQAWQQGAVREPDSQPQPDGELAEQLATVVSELGIEVPAPLLARGLIAWTQLFGMVGFELNGQFVGSFEPADAFFAEAVERMADFVGLTGDTAPPDGAT